MSIDTLPFLAADLPDPQPRTISRERQSDARSFQDKIDRTDERPQAPPTSAEKEADTPAATSPTDERPAETVADKKQAGTTAPSPDGQAPRPTIDAPKLVAAPTAEAAPPTTTDTLGLIKTVDTTGTQRLAVDPERGTALPAIDAKSAIVAPGATTNTAGTIAPKTSAIAANTQPGEAAPAKTIDASATTTVATSIKAEANTPVVQTVVAKTQATQVSAAATAEITPSTAKVTDGSLPTLSDVRAAPSDQRPVAADPKVKMPQLTNVLGTDGRLQTNIGTAERGDTLLFGKPEGFGQAPTTTQVGQTTMSQLVKTTPIPEPVRQVVDAIRVHRVDQTISVRLDPPELGSVSVDLTFDKQTRAVMAVVAAEQTDTASLLRRHLDSLQKELSSAGFEAVHVEVGDHTSEPDGRPEDWVNTTTGDSPDASWLAPTTVRQVNGPIEIISTERIDIRL